mmetsp:Transcript_34819/g.98833  ORF Transcript_34819/g.98833 Transcript_34819/m.98833 type:complete len:257 (+) Transcript_34819:261-1031(+)
MRSATSKSALFASSISGSPASSAGPKLGERAKTERLCIASLQMEAMSAGGSASKMALLASTTMSASRTVMHLTKLFSAILRHSASWAPCFALPPTPGGARRRLSGCSSRAWESEQNTTSNVLLRSLPRLSRSRPESPTEITPNIGLTTPWMRDVLSIAASKTFAAPELLVLMKASCSSEMGPRYCRCSPWVSSPGSSRASECLWHSRSSSRGNTEGSAAVSCALSTPFAMPRTTGEAKTAPACFRPTAALASCTSW